MPQPSSIRDALAAAENLGGRTLSGATRSVPLADLITRTSLSAPRADLAGRRVLLSVVDQFAAAVALTELDGLAARIVLCPPDLKPEHYPTIMAGSDVDTVVSDLAEAAWFTRFAAHRHESRNERGLRYVRCHWPLTPVVAGPPAPPVATEWLLMTSGTTGAPKMVQHGFAGLTAAIKPRASQAEMHLSPKPATSSSQAIMTSYVRRTYLEYRSEIVG